MQNFWQRHWKKIVAVVVAIPILVIAGSWVYVEFIKDEPPAELTAADLADRLTGSTTSAADAVDAVDAVDASSTTDTTDTTDTTATTATTDGTAAAAATSVPGSATPPPTTAASTGTGGDTTVASTAAPAAGADVSGTWNVTTESELRYRVGENINGFETEGVGTTNQITGALTIDGTSVPTAEFVVDMATFQSDEDRRDGQFNGRIMAVAEFPTSRFRLTEPIELGSVPAEGQQITATATGELTLRGVTRPVTFELTAQHSGNRIGVLGNIPVVFADYNIPNPSFGTITTEDNGLLEFILVFERA